MTLEYLAKKEKELALLLKARKLKRQLRRNIKSGNIAGIVDVLKETKPCKN